MIEYLIAFLVVIVIALFLARPWCRIFFAGGKATASTIIGMYLRATNVHLVTDAYLALVQSGYSVEITEVERGYIANKGYISTSKDLVELMNREVKAVT